MYHVRLHVKCFSFNFFSFIFFSSFSFCRVSFKTASFSISPAAVAFSGRRISWLVLEGEMCEIKVVWPWIRKVRPERAAVRRLRADQLAGTGSSSAVGCELHGALCVSVFSERLAVDVRSDRLPLRRRKCAKLWCRRLFTNGPYRPPPPLRFGSSLVVQYN